MRKALSVVLAWWLCGFPCLDGRMAARTNGATQAPKKLTVPEQVLEIPSGTMVEVRLRDNSKLRGRLGTVSEKGFVLQELTGAGPQDRNLTFTDVKSVKVVKKRNPAATAAKIGLGVGAAAGVVFIVLAILFRDD